MQFIAKKWSLLYFKHLQSLWHILHIDYGQCWEFAFFRYFKNFSVCVCVGGGGCSTETFIFQAFTEYTVLKEAPPRPTKKKSSCDSPSLPKRSADGFLCLDRPSVCLCVIPSRLNKVQYLHFRWWYSNQIRTVSSYRNSVITDSVMLWKIQDFDWLIPETKWHSYLHNRALCSYLATLRLLRQRENNPQFSGTY